MEPELWRKAHAGEDWAEAVLGWPPPEGTHPVTGVVRVPFDEAVERRLWCTEHRVVLKEGRLCEHVLVPCVVLVGVAALGEGTE